jgi:hypothetical protein
MPSPNFVADIVLEDLDAAEDEEDEISPKQRWSDHVK